MKEKEKGKNLEERIRDRILRDDENVGKTLGPLSTYFVALAPFIPYSIPSTVSPISLFLFFFFSFRFFHHPHFFTFPFFFFSLLSFLFLFYVNLLHRGSGGESLLGPLRVGRKRTKRWSTFRVFSEVVESQSPFHPNQEREREKSFELTSREAY